MKLYKAIVTVGLVFFAHHSFAAEDVSDRLKSKLSGLKTFQADFTQTVTDFEGQVLQQSQGQLVLKQPDRMLWQVYAPDENTLIADGTTLWHVDPFVEQVVAMDQQHASDNNPLILLARPTSPQWQQFTVEAEANAFVIRAKADDSHIVSLTLTFDGEKLTDMKMLDRQRQNSHIEFSQVQQNQAVDDSLFQFQLPEGFELDDQRN